MLQPKTKTVQALSAQAESAAGVAMLREIRSIRRTDQTLMIWIASGRC